MDRHWLQFTAWVPMALNMKGALRKLRPCSSRRNIFLLLVSIQKSLDVNRTGNMTALAER